MSSDPVSLPPERARIAVIFNPVSGPRDIRHCLDTISQRLADLGATLELHETRHAGHACELAASLCPDIDALLIAGGDGTVSEVVQGLVRTDIPLAILRTGTENLLARELDMPVDPSIMALTLTQGSVVNWDAGEVNGRRFAVVVGVGFDAECARNMMTRRRGHITRWSYFRSVWSAFWSYSIPSLRVFVDERLWYEGQGLVFLGLIKRYGGGIRLLAAADPTDGLLDVLVLSCQTRWGLIPHFIRIVLGRHIPSSASRYIKARHVSVTSPEQVPVQVDGDFGGTLPLSATVLPGALHFLKFTAQ